MNFSPDSKYLAISAPFQVWDIEAGKLIFQDQGNEGVSNEACFSPDGKHYLQINRRINIVNLYSIPGFKKTMECKGSAACFDNEGKRVFVFDAGVVNVFNTVSGKKGKITNTGIKADKEGSVWTKLIKVDKKGFVLTKLIFSPCTDGGNRLILTQEEESSDKRLYHLFIINAGTGASTELKQDEYRDLPLLVSGDTIYRQTNDRIIKMEFDSRNAKTTVIPFNKGTVDDISKDGTLAVVTTREYITIYELQTGIEKFKFPYWSEHGLIRSAKFSPDGQLLATGSIYTYIDSTAERINGMVKIHRTKDGGLFREF